MGHCGDDAGEWYDSPQKLFADHFYTRKEFDDAVDERADSMAELATDCRDRVQMLAVTAAIRVAARLSHETTVRYVLQM